MADHITGDAASLDDPRETGAVRPRLTAAADWRALHDAAEQIAQSAQMRADIAQRETDAIRGAALTLVHELDPEQLPTDHARRALERLRSLL